MNEDLKLYILTQLSGRRYDRMVFVKFYFRCLKRSIKPFNCFRNTKLNIRFWTGSSWKVKQSTLRAKVFRPIVISASYYFYFCINQFIKIRFSWSDRPLQAANSVLFIQSTQWLSLIILLATLLMPNLIEDCLYNLEWFFFSLTLNTQVRSFISWSVKTKRKQQNWVDVKKNTWMHCLFSWTED